MNNQFSGLGRRTVIKGVLSFMAGASLLSAQARMSDRDIESLMNNLKDDSKSFRNTFNSAVGKSTIRKTSREKDAKNLVERFQKQTEGMLNQFRDKKKADNTLPTVIASADQIEKLLMEVPLGGGTDGSWRKVKSELAGLAMQFNVPYNPGAF